MRHPRNRQFKPQRVLLTCRPRDFAVFRFFEATFEGFWPSPDKKSKFFGLRPVAIWTKLLPSVRTNLDFTDQAFSPITLGLIRTPESSLIEFGSNNGHKIWVYGATSLNTATFVQPKWKSKIFLLGKNVPFDDLK